MYIEKLPCGSFLVEATNDILYLLMNYIAMITTIIKEDLQKVDKTDYYR